MKILPACIALLLPLSAGVCAGWLVSTIPAAPVAFSHYANAEIAPFSVIPLFLPEISPSQKTSCDIFAQITAAKERLASVPLVIGDKEYKYTEVRAGRAVAFKDPEKQIGLGLLNADTCTMRTVIITKRGDELIAPRGWDIKPVRRANGIRWNNWATEYSVNEPSGWFVIGVKYPYVQEKTDVLYTAYNQRLDMPELIAAGRTYPRTVADRAYEKLRAAGVVSRTDPERLVADVPLIASDYAARRLPIEHMDQTEFILDPAWTTDRVHVLIGANRDAMASYTCSPAAACGPLQWTSGTYRIIARTYPAAHLISDFVAGARDPLNAMVATILLDDYNLSVVQHTLHPNEFATLVADPRITEEILASAYNTGVGRTLAVVRAYLANGKKGDWIAAVGKAKNSHLLAETKGYIMKLRYIRDQWSPAYVAQAESKTPRQ